MDSKEFKNIFGKAAKSNGFEKTVGGWYKETAECIAILELQKSSFANSYYLNIKVFIQGAFERRYTPNKDLIKSAMGHITKQIRDKDVLNLDDSISEEKREETLEKLFSEFIVPFTDKVLSRSGILELSEKGEIFLLPAVKVVLEEG
ncbi:hypothetical protein DC498_25285 [Terrimonas sp.]|uniref:DUF4304 domain-containing protein n=1 Tax=Terrimonas sp. TaxID=1914338 RepID=UPI000D51F47B|nr:DUF4304 domain-containing protein [Terrimonas sp.]PVD49398.1 hypothetical protein DC498_25285 [Terrimonas sp.]